MQYNIRNLNMIHHGGLCCGIKTIHCFPSNPEIMLSEVTAEERLGRAEFVEGFRPEYRPEKMPEETALQRLDRLIAFKDQHIRYGIIEAVLVSNTPAPGMEPHPASQKRIWGPILEERGFKQVSQCFNSNSWNTIYVYHRVVDRPTDKEGAEPAIR